MYVARKKEKMLGYRNEDEMSIINKETRDKLVAKYNLIKHPTKLHLIPRDGNADNLEMSNLLWSNMNAHQVGSWVNTPKNAINGYSAKDSKAFAEWMKQVDFLIEKTALIPVVSK